MLILVKTIGGTNGSPINCSSCGSSHFIKAGIGWNCDSCGLYIPALLRDTNRMFMLNKQLEELNDIRMKLKNQIDELEKLIEG